MKAKTKEKAGFVSTLGYWVLLWSCRLVGWLPTWFLYHCLLDVIYFFLYKVVKYRVRVVRDNLRTCFPEKGEEELRDIEKRFYYHLSEIMVDTIDFVSITPKQLKKRLVYTDNELHEQRVEGQNWIAALGHYGSWEYFSGYPAHTSHNCCAVYHPLHNKAFDRLMYYSRTRFGMKPIAMHNMLRYLATNLKTPGEHYAIGMISDQTPPRVDKPHWFDFLGRPTVFFTGFEKLARKFNLQVYYFHVEKRSRARYRGYFEMIYDGQEEVAPGEITERYVRRLEEQIRQRPELWMWSHRRWKHRYEPAVDTAAED